jgi:CheY-like chemotaxis protein
MHLFVEGTILICEDRPTLRALLREALSEHDYSIFEARDGDESIELVRSVRPDIVVLDMVMPGRSGLDVLAEVRRDPELSHTLVILCTATSVTLDENLDGFDADRYLRKPFSPLELASVVEELLGART